MKIFKLLAVPCSIFLLAGLATSPANAANAGTWNSTTSLKGDVTIPAGQNIVVAPNTIIKVAPGTKITISGSLTASNGLTLSGTNWSGLIILGSANFVNFKESGAETSFRVGPQGTLSIHGGNISGVNGPSVVEGTFIADHLTYDKGSGGGISSLNYM
jgi:hypothetical protein